MKKIALLFTILCASQLHGMEMEVEEQPASYSTLPQELKQEIINIALAKSVNINQAINTIKIFGALHGTSFDNPENFTRLVHILSDKFHFQPLDVAKIFKGPAAEKYINLFNKLSHSILAGDLESTKQSIADGADVNALSHETSLDIAYFPGGSGMFLVGDHYEPYKHNDKNTIKIINLLLEHGAYPYIHRAHLDREKKLLEDIGKRFRNYPEDEQAQLKSAFIKAMAITKPRY